jgi:hypothetical protein
MPENRHVPFGKGPLEKDPNHGNLASGLLHRPGGVDAPAGVLTVQLCR